MLSIIISQHRTEEFIRLCLRSIRKYSRGDTQTIVIDNNSKDGSVEYLRRLRWIELIENEDATVGSTGHWEGLDLGKQRVAGDWVCFFHSDTIVLKAGWDIELLSLLERENAVGLGTTVRDFNQFETPFERFRRNVREMRTKIKKRLRNRADSDGKVLSHVFIIKKSILDECAYDFATGGGEALNAFYHTHLKGKHAFLLLARKDLEGLIWHTSNVTSIVTGYLSDKRLVEKCNHKENALTASEGVRAIMADAGLDL